MSFPIHQFAGVVKVSAGQEGLAVHGPAGVNTRALWPAEALAAPSGWRTATEIEQLLELGLAEERSGEVIVPYANFEAIASEMPVSMLGTWTQHSPFLLKIDRKSDLGRPDFQYRYEFLLAGRPVHLERLGYYVRRAASKEIFLLDFQMYSLVEAMDAFNALPPEAKTQQASWLAFAKIKGCAAEVGATLDSTLRNNDVIVPSTLGLDMKEDQEGGLTFLPKCEELSGEDFHQVFERNPGAEKLYSIDRPGLGRVRIVLTNEQHDVLKRMKRVRSVKGELKERLQRDPAQAFDGLGDSINLPYGDRVTGIGAFQAGPAPRAEMAESSMSKLWADQGNETDPVVRGTSAGQEGAAQEGLDPVDRVETDAPFESNGAHSPSARPEAAGSQGKRERYLLIDNNEESVRTEFSSEAEKAARFAAAATYVRPQSLRQDRNLHRHQEVGVRWLQTCSQIPGRKGVLLADDMGVGKTIQILTFLAWCIESGKFPDLSCDRPPFRPILIVAPLILLDTRTWEREMNNFFAREGDVFQPVITLHGSMLAQFRRLDAEGPEVEIGKPILDLNKIQRNKVVITNYETVKNYQHSFAYLKDGKSLWSVIVSDEAQEFKIPNTKLSHAMKALKADLQIACTGTPVENRMLDLWNLCDVLQPGLLASAREFVNKFERVQDADGQESNLQALKKKLLFQQHHAFLLRRTKSEVADLPPKQVVKLACPMSSAEINAHHSLLRALKAQDAPGRFLTVLHQFAQLYQHPALLSEDAEDSSVSDLISQSSKLQTLLRTLHEIRGKREKAIIFVRHRAMQGILAKVLESEFRLPVRIINGDTKSRGTSLRSQGTKTRQAILSDFQNSPGFNLLILSPFVAGIGLTIVEANHVVHYGRWWNPAVESQATDRAYRIGQNKPVSVYLPILSDPTGKVSPSFDERLDALMEKKQRLAEDFLRPLPPEDEMGGELFSDLREEARSQRA